LGAFTSIGGSGVCAPAVDNRERRTPLEIAVVVSLVIIAPMDIRES
jgi:hypothetical protein